MGGRDVQLTGADADGPVHAAQAVPEAEGSDVGELAAVARVVGPVLPHEAVRAGDRDPRVEVVRQGTVVTGEEVTSGAQR